MWLDDLQIAISNAAQAGISGDEVRDQIAIMIEEYGLDVEPGEGSNYVPGPPKGEKKDAL